MMESNVDDVILKKLQAYGDSVLDGTDKRKKKKSSSRKSNLSDGSLVEFSSLHSDDGQKKRKKKKNKHEQDDVADDELELNDDVKLSGHERRLHEMSEQLGLSEFKQQLNEGQNKQKVVIHKATLKQEPEVVVFNSHKSKKTKKKELDAIEALSAEKNPDFDMRQARYDVQKFGIKGFEGSQKEEAMTALLIKLGAKPPKNKFVNYKDYQEDRRRQKEAEVQKREMDRKFGLKVSKGGKGKKRSSSNDIGHIDGQIGKWKSGVLFVKKDDLKGFKKKPKLK